MRIRFNGLFMLTFVILLFAWGFSINGFLGIGFSLYMLTIISMIVTVVNQLGTSRRIAHLRLVK